MFTLQEIHEQYTAMCNLCINTLVFYMLWGFVGTPSALLPSIAELVSRYSTAEDVVSTKTISRPQVNGLSPLLETHTVPPESINSR